MHSLASKAKLSHISDMRRLLISLLLLPLLLSCSFDPIRLDLAPGWSSKSLAAWRNITPQMLTIAKDGHWLYLSCENDAGISNASLAAINMKSGRRLILLSGLHRAHGLQIAPDTSLWIGEQFSQGMLWRVTEPDKLPEDQRIDRGSLSISHPSITPLAAAGRFTHSGFTFSTDERFAYLASADAKGRIYRYEIRNRKLAVLHADGWVAIATPESAEAEAEHRGATAFAPLRGMTRLPDGIILIAEPERGRIISLDDRGAQPEISTYLEGRELHQPEELLWDESRQWLWISDGDKPSRLWAYNGSHLTRIATHNEAHITGISVFDKTLYLNLRDNISGPEITLQLTEQE